MPDLRDRADMLALASDFENPIPLLRELIAAAPVEARARREPLMFP